MGIYNFLKICEYSFYASKGLLDNSREYKNNCFLIIPVGIQTVNLYSACAKNLVRG